MAGDRDKPLSSEEMLRRAREAPGAESTPAPTTDRQARSTEDVESSLPDDLTVETDEPEVVIETPEQGSSPDWEKPAIDSLPGSTPVEEEGPLAAPVPTEPQPSRWRKIWRVGRWVLLAWIVLGVIGALLDDSTSIDAVDVGDCFIYEPVELISSVETVDCSESHDLELYAKVDITGFEQAYPGEQILADWLQERCVTRFDGYVGSNYLTSEYWVFTISPSDESWEADDRLGLCAVYIGDAVGDITSSTGSARNSGR